MRKYLLLFLAILLLLAWIGDQFLVNHLRTALESQNEIQLERQTDEIARQIQLASQNEEHGQIDDVLQKVAADSWYQFELINKSGQLWYDSTKGKISLQDESNKPEVISSQNSETVFLIRDNSMVATRNLTGVPIDGIVRVSESYTPISELTRSARKFVWIFVILIAILGGTLMIVFARRSLSPLNEFARVARMIGIGQYNAVPALHGRRDNWTVLADAFRHMKGELEQREVRILDNSSRLQAVLSSMIEGVLAIDSKGRIMLANRAACDMLQMSHTDIFGRDFLEIFRLPELTQAIEKTQRDRKFSKCEFQTRDMPRKIISARVSVLSDSQQSKTPGIAIVLHDVTDLRQLETLRRDFVANVSHELKTPLASIKAYAETLKMGAINDEQKNIQFVRQIESQADLLNEQIQDLLQLARVESGQKNWEIAPISVTAIAIDCIRQFDSEADSRNIRLQLHGLDDDLFVNADKDGVRTILSNLISNALHYTSEGGTVDVRIADLNKFIGIEVVDDGIGIAADHHARIFERFYRVDKARSRDHGGTGLGLAIVKHLCQAFGGSVELDSELGKGSRFIVKLPNSNR